MSLGSSCLDRPVGKGELVVNENAAPFDVENFLFEFVYPSLHEAIQFEKKSLL